LAEKIFLDDSAIDREHDALHSEILSVGEVVRRILRDYVLQRWKLLVFAIVTMTFVAATTGALPFLTQKAADDIFVAKDEMLLYLLPVIVILVMAVRSAAEYGSRVAEAFIGARIVADLRVELFRNLTNADLGWLQSVHTGRFVSLFMNDVGVVNSAAASTLTAMFKNALQVIFLVAAMFYMDPLLSVIVIGALPLGAYLLRLQRSRMNWSVSRQLQETGDFGSQITQTLQNVRVVKAYQQEELETERASGSVDRALEYSMQIARTRAATGPITEGLSGIGLAAAIFYGGWQGINGTLTLGEFMGFMTAAMLIYQPVKALANLNNVLMQGVTAASRVFGILDRQRQIVDADGAKTLAVDSGSIRFENVNFSYDGDVPVLNDFSLDVAPGSRVALVGPSGSGKTTVLNLVLRFFDPQDGRVMIDGQDLSQATLASTRAASALLTQDPVLFDDTVLANITYGSPDAGQDDVDAAAKAAAADAFIDELPKGFDTNVGEAGNLLSGGQKQRIAFARAILRDAPIILLDEPTSALDAEAEAKVQLAMDTLLQGRTVLMIAHRLSTVKKADMICVLERGQIVESGTHDELLAKGGTYKKLYRSQFADTDNSSEEATRADEDLVAGEH